MPDAKTAPRSPLAAMGSRTWRRLGVGLMVGMLMATVPAGSASAAPVGEFTTYNLGPAGYGGDAIASGPDGNMWFTNNANNSIGRITPAGAVSYFPVPSSPSLTSGTGLFAIAAGPDGNMWFTGFYANLVGKITPSGAITTYQVPTLDAFPLGITAGPDGNLWFVLDSANGIGRITPDGVITEFPIPAPGSTGSTAITSSSTCVMCGYQITAGPLDSLWFTIPSANLIGRITTGGVVSTFPVATTTTPSPMNAVITLGDITAGSDGNLWITQNADGKITRMTPTGVVTDFALPSPTSEPLAITPGPDNDLWIAAYAGGALLRLALPDAKGSALIRQFTIPTTSSTPTSVATGADGSIWYISVVGQAPADSLQVGHVGTGKGPILKATVLGSGGLRAPLTCSTANSSGWPIQQVRYQWLRGGKVIAGQSRRSFTPGLRDLGARVSCKVAVTYGTALNQLGATAKPVRIR